jgi:hypothetical protein
MTQRVIRERKKSAYCQCFSVDVTVESEIESLFQQIGMIDHLVLTIKAPLVVAPFLELNAEDVRLAFETNFGDNRTFTNQS